MCWPRHEGAYPMPVSLIDTRSAAFETNRSTMLERLRAIDDVLAETRAGGGERYVERHRARGKLLPRERIEGVLDRDAPFLELQPFVGWGSEYRVGGSVVTGIGVVEGVEVVLV